MKLTYDLKDKLNLYFSEKENDLIRTITDWVAVRSVKGKEMPGMPFGNGPAEALALALETGKIAGFSIQNHENYVGTMDINDKETRLGILCHLDVVEEGPGWQTDPYQVVIKDGMLYGRGTSDDKGPAVASLFAMQAVKDLGIPLQYNARLILGTDEESGCADIEYYFKKESPPPFTISPDGDFPVVNTEKGGLRPKLSKSWQEDDQLPRIIEIHGGNRINVIPAQTEVILEGFCISDLMPYCTKIAQNTGVTFDLVKLDEQVKILANGKSEHAATHL